MCQVDVGRLRPKWKHIWGVRSVLVGPVGRGSVGVSDDQSTQVQDFGFRQGFLVVIGVVYEGGSY